MDRNEERPMREKALQHLEEALEVENTEEMNYHLKEALQLLKLDGSLCGDRDSS